MNTLTRLGPAAFCAGLFLLAAPAGAQQSPLTQNRPPPPLNAFTNFARVQLTPLEPKTNASKTEGAAVYVSKARQTLYDALLLVQDKDYTNAIPMLEEAMREDPSLIVGWEALGWSYWHLDRRAEAEKTWDRLLILAPQSVTPYNILSQVAVYKKEMEKAESLLRKSLELDPNQFDTRLNLALVLAWQAKTEEAEQLLLQGIREEPDRLDVRIELANVFYLLQKYEDSAAQWKIVCEVIPDNADFLIEWARSLLYSGELEQARTTARKAAELDGGSLRALNVLADVAQTSRRPEEALPEIKKLLERTDTPLTRSQLRSRLVGLMRELYDKDPKRFPLKDIMAECSEAIDEDPRNINMQLFLAEVYMMDRRYEDALRLLTHVLEEHNPHNYRAKRGLLEIYLVKGEFTKAEQMIDSIYDNTSADNTYRFMDIARLENRKGNYHEAIRILDKMEREGMKGAVFNLLYHGLSISDWEPGRPARLFREHILFLKRAGFKFLKPEEIPAYLESRKTVALPPPKPALYKLIRWIRYSFTGEGAPESANAALDNYKPDRVVCVTFDDALRTSFRHATPVALEFDIPLGMNVPVGNIVRRDYGISSWGEIKGYMNDAVWSFGSHCIDAGIQGPGYEDGYLVAPLPNRLWLKEKNRFETMREWSLRVRAEMQESRRIIVNKLGLDPETGARFVAYPYGEIGQMEGSNIRVLEDLRETILNEAGTAYRIGFIQSLFGYSTPDDNSLVFGRYEPAPNETGEEVLHHAIENHPVLMARRLKAEIAALQGKPHLAYKMLDLLDRDGYPTKSLRELRELVDSRIAGRVGGADIDVTPGKGERLISLSKPYLGVDAFSMKANRQIKIDEYGVRGGLNLAPRLLAEGWYKQGEIEQEVVSNIYFKTRATTVSETLTIVRGTDNGTPINRRENTITYQTQEVQTNITQRNVYNSDYSYAGGRLSYRIKDGSNLQGHFGVKEFDGEEEEGNEPVWGLTHAWKPAPALDFVTLYTRDLVPSGRRIILSDTVGLTTLWRAKDWWEINAQGRYSYYHDDNAILHVRASSMWLVGERQNIYLGLIYELSTMDERSSDYWSPYWEERIGLALQMSRTFQAFHAGAEARVGMAREKGRPDDLEDWRALQVQGESQGFYAGDEPGTDWEPTVGLGANLRRMLGNHWELEGQGSCSFYSDYSEYIIGGTLLYHF